MAGPIPIACSLDTDDYASRLDAIREVGSSGLLSSRPHPDGAGADLFFRNEEDTRRHLREVMQAEARCCAFLDMDLDAEDETLRLSISGPADAAPIVQDLMRSFESGRGSSIDS